MCDEEQLSVSKAHKRRWRKVFRAIYFTRVLVSSSKKEIDKNDPLSRSLSYVAIDMQPAADEDPWLDKHVSFLNVDRKRLSEMVRDKNFEYLSHFGGVKEVVSVLESDVKDGIMVGRLMLYIGRSFLVPINTKWHHQNAFLAP
ncbi:hypothetical protein SLA2020_274020 [Shorea laevis]